MKWLAIGIIGFVTILLVISWRTHGNDIADLRERIAELESQLAAAEEATTTLESEAEPIPESTPTETAESAGTEASPEPQVEELAEELFGIAGAAGPSRIDNLELTASALRADLENLEKAVFHAPEEETAPTPRPTPSPSRIDDLIAEVADLKASIYITNGGTPTSRIDDLESAIAGLETIVYGAEGADLSVRLDALEAAIVDLGGEVVIPEDTSKPGATDDTAPAPDGDSDRSDDDTAPADDSIEGDSATK